MTEPKRPDDDKGTGRLSSLPTLIYYHKTYALSLGENDQKAVGVFKSYESHEKLRRLQNELVAVKNGHASTKACEVAIGKKRLGKYQKYEYWAELMLLWVASAKR